MLSPFFVFGNLRYIYLYTNNKLFIMAEQNYDFPTEVISLPSEGKGYPESSPLSKGTIEIKYMTAKEEEILTSQNLIKKGIVLNKLFESIVIDKDVNVDDILLGDKNAIMLATRILAYGAKYPIEITGADGEKEQIDVDLSKVQTKDVDLSKLKRDNKYEFTTPSGNKMIFKLLTHGDEQKIDTDIKALAKFNKGGISAELTTRYRYMIQEIDGKTDTKSITDFINNRFLAKDTRAFREYIRELSPDINMEFDYQNPETGEKEVRSIPMGVGFFWPTE
jgi:hypothetical protein